MPTPKTPEPRSIGEHIHDALLAQARRILAAAAPEVRPALRAELADWYSTAYERLTIELRVDTTRAGRPDTRSTRAYVVLHTAAGAAPLLDVLVRDLVDDDGEPIDAKATARDLLAQQERVTDAQIAELLDGEAGR